MLDADMLIVDGGTVNISATADLVAGTDASAAVNLGKTGIPEDCWFLVHITTGSAEAIEPLSFHLQVTVDNGSNWTTSVAAVTFLTVVAAGNEILAVACGPIDLRVDKPYAAADIDVRVCADWTTVAVADDVTYDAYLCGRQSFRAVDAA